MNLVEDAAEPAVIRVSIVDADALVRSALSLMLGGQPDLLIVGEAADGRAGVALAHQQQPDVVLMDIRMPVMDGLEATRLIHEHPDPPRVIVLTTVDAVHKVAAGETMLSPTATRTLVRRIRDESPSASPRPRAGAVFRGCPQNRW